MSLADALIDDFMDAEMESNETHTMEVIEEVDEMAIELEYSLDKPVSYIAKLKDSIKLLEVLRQIQEFIDLEHRTNHGSFDSDTEYQLIVKSNDLISDIDNEVNIIHNYVKDIYKTRYPELSTVVQDHVEYLKTVKTFGNNIKSFSKFKDELVKFLAPATIMVVSVTSSTSSGTDLPETRLANVLEACDTSISLIDNKQFVLQFVESRMPIFAPNLSTLLGSSIAAKLIGKAGGLTALSKTPGCNLLNFGSKKKSESGFGNINSLRGCGFIYYSENVQRLPPNLRVKAGKLYGNKAALAARVDLSHSFTNGEKGSEFLAQIQKQVDIWQAPPPVKTIKALPAPIEVMSKRRGGRRHRKMKERMGLTELSKSANRMEFGDILSSYDNEMSVNAGRLGKTNRIRAATVDGRTKARISKSLTQKLQKQNQTQNAIWGGTTTTKKISGTATTVTFTPLNGVEICTPLRIEPKPEGGKNYFSSDSAWHQLKK